MTEFTFGADPEVFLKKNGKPASAYGILPGNKENPHKTVGGAIQVDGMAAEFNIDPVPQTDFESFNTRIIQQIRHIRKHAEGFTLNVSPVQDFSEEFLAAQPDEAKELGCDPDYNAYTLSPNPRPDGDRTFRTGAGHVHIGWGADIPVDNEEHIEICANFVKILDATVGLFMTIIDNEPRRRELYGKAGAFRPKPYGVEYRTPSNVWIKNRDTRRVIFTLMNYAVFLATIKNIWVEPGKSLDEVKDYINTGDSAAALSFLRDLMRRNFTHDKDFQWTRSYLANLQKEKEQN